MTTQTDNLDIQLRVLKADEARRDLEAARRAVESMSDETKRGMIEAAAATERENAALRRLTAEQAEAARRARDYSAGMNRLFNLEMISRVIGVFRQIGAALDSLIEKNAAMRASADRAAEAMGRMEGTFAAGFERGAQFSTTLDGISAALGHTAGAADLAGQAFGRLFRYITGGGPLGYALRNMRIPGTTENVQDYLNRMGEEAVAGRTTNDRVSPSQLGADTGESDPELARVLGEDVTRSVQTRAPDRYSSGAGDTRRGGGGGGQSEAERAAERIQRAIEQVQNTSTSVYDGATAAALGSEEAINESIRRQSASWAELNRANLEGVQTKSDLMTEAHELAMREMEIEKDYQRQVSEERRAQILQIANASASVMATASGVFGQLATQQQQQIANITSALKASGASQAQITKAVAAHEARLDKLRKAEGGLLIAYNAVMAATATAEAIESGAKQDYGAMAGHIAAAIAYAAAGAMAAVKLGSDDGSSAGASAAPTTSYVAPAREKREETGEKRPGGGRLQLVVMGSSDPDLVGITERAEWQFERGGYDRPARGLGFYG
jgi:hypothetical protein